MVQKSKILGKSSLIFITIGTTHFQFNRLFLAIDNALGQLKSKAQLIVQSGSSSYQWRYKNALIKAYFTPLEMINIIKKADKIITHAGPGTLFLISQHSKIMPLVIGRSSKDKEHADDHQLLFTKFIKSKVPGRFKKYFVIKEVNLLKQLREYLIKNDNRNELLQYVFNNTNINELSNNLNHFLTY